MLGGRATRGTQQASYVFPHVGAVQGDIHPAKWRRWCGSLRRPFREGKEPVECVNPTENKDKCMSFSGMGGQITERLGAGGRFGVVLPALLAGDPSSPAPPSSGL